VLRDSLLRLIHAITGRQDLNTKGGEARYQFLRKTANPCCAFTCARCPAPRECPTGSPRFDRELAQQHLQSAVVSFTRISLHEFAFEVVAIRAIGFVAGCLPPLRRHSLRIGVACRLYPHPFADAARFVGRYQTADRPLAQSEFFRTYLFLSEFRWCAAPRRVARTVWDGITIFRRAGLPCSKRMSSLQQIIGEGDVEIERFRRTIEETRRLIAERNRLRDDLCALRDASHVFLARVRTWPWQCCGIAGGNGRPDPEASP
jgi:hypothetical protein